MIYSIKLIIIFSRMSQYIYSHNYLQCTVLNSMVNNIFLEKFIIT
jgi:hypothetical protein